MRTLRLERFPYAGNETLRAWDMTAAKRSVAMTLAHFYALHYLDSSDRPQDMSYMAWVDSLEPGTELLILAGAEHFFHARLTDLRETVMELIARVASRSPAIAKPPTTTKQSQRGNSPS